MYLQNKYTTWYKSIIDNAIARKKPAGYSEGHHILPKCLGGTNDKSNIVRLTAREHFICHQLLVKMVPVEYKSKMALAATKMWQRGNNQGRDYRFHSRTYDSLKKQASAYLSELNRKRWENPEMRERLRKSMSAASRPAITDATKEKLSKSLKRFHQNKKDNARRSGAN